MTVFFAAWSHYAQHLDSGGPCAHAHGRFVVYTFLGSAVWNTALVVAKRFGRVAGNPALARYYRNVVLIVAVLVGVGLRCVTWCEGGSVGERCVGGGGAG